MKRLLAILAALACASCAPQPPPVAGDPVAGDPVLQGHASWCDSMPASGYCTVPEKR